MSSKKREAAGLAGREYVRDEKVGMSDTQMCQNFIDQMDKGFEMWKPRKRYSLIKV